MTKRPPKQSSSGPHSGEACIDVSDTPGDPGSQLPYQKFTLVYGGLTTPDISGFCVKAIALLDGASAKCKVVELSKVAERDGRRFSPDS